MCSTGAKWPTKGQAMEHIKEKHLESLRRVADRRARHNEDDVEPPTDDSLIRAVLERSGEDPNRRLDGETLKAIE